LLNYIAHVTLFLVYFFLQLMYKCHHCGAYFASEKMFVLHAQRHEQKSLDDWNFTV
jgi:hypothetical protein